MKFESTPVAAIRVLPRRVRDPALLHPTPIWRGPSGEQTKRPVRRAALVWSNACGARGPSPPLLWTLFGEPSR